MTTKKFNQMTTKKLNALLATASDEDKAAIEVVLAAREQVSAAPAESAPAESAPAETHKKLTDEERHALAEELKVNINHRCQVVPFNTIDWVDGFIAGVIEEKRSNKVLYAIKTDDGRRIVKVHDSKLLKILDEVVTLEKKIRARKSNVDKAEKVEWTPESLAEEINAVIGNVGKTVEVEQYSTVDADNNEHVESAHGRIMAIVPDKRSQTLLYRIVLSMPTEADPNATKITHKVVTNPIVHIAEEFDAEGQEINDKYRARREAIATRNPLTPQDRVMHCEELLKKAEEKLQKATEELELKKQQLADAKVELDKYLAAQSGETSAEAPAQDENPEEPLA